MKKWEMADNLTIDDFKQEVITQFAPKDIAEVVNQQQTGLDRLWKMLHQYYNKEEKQILALWNTLNTKDQNKILQALTYVHLLNKDTVVLPLLTYKTKKGKLVAGIRDGGILLYLEDKFQDTTEMVIYPLSCIDWTLAGYGETKLIDMRIDVAQYSFPTSITLGMEKMQFFIQKRTREGNKTYSIAHHVMEKYGLPTTISKEKRTKLKEIWETNRQLFDE